MYTKHDNVTMKPYVKQLIWSQIKNQHIKMS